MESMHTTPPDNAERQAIIGDLDRTMLVEAAAGTGKTTMLIQRMIALVAEGRCTIDTLAAVTFTRKAAAEIRARFQICLERQCASATGEAKQRLQAALKNIERCFIGTIHSFCARLLRERPVEAGVDLEFVEIDEETDMHLRRQAWHEYIESLFANDDQILFDLEEVGLQLVRSTDRHDPLLSKLDELGLEVAQLGPAFLNLAEFPDVDEWPAPAVALPNLTTLVAELRRYVAHMQELIKSFGDPKTDKLMPLYRQIVRMAKVMDLNRPAELMEILERFREDPGIVQKHWPGKGPQAKAEKQRWDDFCRTHAQPALQRWREHRYEVVMRAILPAVNVYNRLRSEAKALNFQDLLLKSAALLRDKPQVRRYFRQRFTHLLIDEFQDTDPIQAEVMLLLAADDPAETNWQNCRPVGGSLFVVGDPKQSIYRFRRADIVTYRKVKEIIRQQGGEVVALAANFRSTRAHIEWVNAVFGSVFPSSETDQSPTRRDLLVGRTSDAELDSQLAGLRSLPIPAHFRKNRDVAEYEAQIIAQYIRRAVDEGWAVPRQSANEDRRARPGDFLIITRMKTQLSVYGNFLQRLGIPHQVTGGRSVNQNDELSLLYSCLLVVARPDDGLAMLAVLRSELFGISDAGLYAFQQAGGKFSLFAPLPVSNYCDEATAICGAIERLRQYASWLKQLPLLAAVERIGADVGLLLRAAAALDGSAQAGALLKSLEILRARREETLSTESLLEWLESLIQHEETHDALPLRPDEEAPVRIMNIHKAKGLEAPVVFLADPTGEKRHSVDMHIDRRGDRTHGYLAVYGQKKNNWSPPTLLAHPPGWQTYAAREQEFLDAENLRLLYVAATRAGSQLIVSQLDRSTNPWRFFEPHMPSNCAALSTCPPAQAAPAEFDLDVQQIIVAAESIQARWQYCAAATYDVVSAKSLSLPTGPKLRGTGEDAAQWGTVIHRLLEVAATQPAEQLERLAFALLEKHGLHSGRSSEALQTVDSVRHSAIWQRAQQSPACYTEIPFGTLLDEKLRDEPLLNENAAAANQLPTILRGIIDLVFLDGDGWVVVDYKTEQIDAQQIPALAQYYRGQVQTYARYWQKVTGASVAEAGLYFTHPGVYHRLW